MIGSIPVIRLAVTGGVFLMPAENDLMMRDEQIDPDHGRADQVPRPIDRKRRPGDQLDKKPACAEAHGGKKYAYYGTPLYLF